MIDRGQLLRRLGLAAALPLLAAPEALADDGGGGNFPRHPRWRFVFVDHATTNPLAIATQFGAQDACSLVECEYRWAGSPRGDVPEMVKAFRRAVSEKAGGIAVALVDDRAFNAVTAEALRAGIPVVAYGADARPGSGNRRLAYVGQDHHRAGVRAGEEIARLAGSGDVALLVPEARRPWLERRLEGALVGIGRVAGAGAKVVRVGEGREKREARIEEALGDRRVRALLALDGDSTRVAAEVVRRLGLQVRAGGYDLLPNDLALIEQGALEFAVDQQPYLQGFLPVLQLFLARISEGVVAPSDIDTGPVFLRKENVKTYLATRSRFEGSSSVHEYPLRRA